MDAKASSWLDVVLALIAFAISMTIAFEVLPPEDNTGQAVEHERPQHHATLR